MDIFHNNTASQSAPLIRYPASVMFTHQTNNGPGHMVYYGDISWELSLSDDKEQATLKIENLIILGKNSTIVN